MYYPSKAVNGQDKDFVFSESVKAGKRIYYFDVKQSKNGEKFISITESKKIVDESSEYPHVTFEKHKIFLYKEDYEKFSDALNKVIAIAKGEPSDSFGTEPDYSRDDTAAADAGTALSDDELNLDVDF